MAIAYTGLGGVAGYGENQFSTATKAAGYNDDGSVYVSVTSIFGPAGINFFGTHYTGFYINSNGTITFGAPDTTTSTTNLNAETTPTIAAFWTDINIGAGGQIYWDIDATTGAITITWDGVSRFSGTGSSTFQLQITSTGGGDFTTEFIYEDIQYSGSGTDVADAGFTNGAGTTFLLDGSGVAAETINYETNNFGSGPTGSYLVTFSGGQPVGTVKGTSGNDLIGTSYLGDPEGDVIDGGDGTGALGH